MSTNEEKIQQELEVFRNQINIHDLPDIFHYWSNKYLAPMLHEFEIQHPDDLYINQIVRDAENCSDSKVIIASIGSGNCDTEIRIAAGLVEKGLTKFTIDCLELNPDMLARGEVLAKEASMVEYMMFTQVDLNEWKPDKTYTSIIANQSLHHILNLEKLFSDIKSNLHARGSFIAHDMIGRNGHMRWPEALEPVHKFWRELPDTHKSNYLLGREEVLYENWDCSNEGFEGIRAQDILPMLLKEFNFEIFIGFANIIDPFIDRAFGHNYNSENPWDRKFIDRVHEYDERAMREGSLKPTHMMAVMCIEERGSCRFSRTLSPEFSVRPPNDESAKYSVQHKPSIVKRIFRKLRRLF